MVLAWGICSGGRVFLRSLHKTLSFCLFPRVLTKPLAHELQTRRMKESVCWPGPPFATGCFSLLFMDMAFSAQGQGRTYSTSHQIETRSKTGLTPEGVTEISAQSYQPEGRPLAECKSKGRVGRRKAENTPLPHGPPPCTLGAPPGNPTSLLG